MSDEFTQADRDDWELERAAQHDLERDDWLELHGEALVHPTLAEAIAQEAHAKRRVAEGTELIIEEEME